MAKSAKMAELAKNYPKLKQAWDEYGHAIPWDQLDGYAKNPSDWYVVLRWKMPDGMIDMADLAFNGEIWDMQNDGFEPITEADWRKLKIPSQCDWFVIEGHPGYKSLS